MMKIKKVIATIVIQVVPIKTQSSDTTPLSFQTDCNLIVSSINPLLIAPLLSNFHTSTAVSRIIILTLSTMPEPNQAILLSCVQPNSF